MKRGIGFLVLMAFLLIGLIFAFSSLYYSILLYKNLTGESLNFRTTEGSVSFFVEGSDNQPPSVSVVFPLPGSYSSHQTSLNYAASDNFGLSSCWYSLDLGVTNSSVTCGNNVSGITSSEGTNIWIVYANDTSNNLNSSSVSFNVSIASSGGGSSGGGGGGAAASTPQNLGFETSVEELNLLLVSGEKQSKTFSVSNTGGGALSINLEVSEGIRSFISLDEKELSLNPGESKDIVVNFEAPDSGIAVGKIILTSGSIRKEIFVLVNARSSDALFDASITIPESDKVLLLGNNLRAFISLTEVGGKSNVDVTVNYLVKDFDGNEFSKESETFRLSKTKSYVKEFSTSDLTPGDYVVSIELLYPGGFASSSSHFVIKGKDNGFLIKSAIFSVLGISVLVIILLSLLKYKKSLKYSSSFRRGYGKMKEKKSKGRHSR